MGSWFAPEVNTFKRNTGPSAIARAAYRSGQSLYDERYGERQDYTRRQGVTDSFIMAPDDAPDWITDRETLWNAAEAAEKRGDSRLARELMLPLPDELTADTRREIVRDVAAEIIRQYGVAIDCNIHAPNRQGDERNHHAHMMFTTRAITPEGMGAKTRELDNPRSSGAAITAMRKFAADRTNEALELAGSATRVSHLSYEARGIDREAQQHEGPTVTAMKRKDKDTRIGAENDRREDDNRRRTDAHVAALKELAKVAADRQKFESWAHEKEAGLEARQQLTQLDFERQQDTRKSQLEDELKAFYGASLATVQAEAAKIDTRLKAKGIVSAFRRVFTGKSDRERLDALQATIKDTHARMQEARDRLAKDLAVEKGRLTQIQEKRRAEQHEGIERARERKEKTLAERAAEASRKAQERQETEQARKHREDGERAQSERVSVSKREQEKEGAQVFSLAERARRAGQHAPQQETQQTPDHSRDHDEGPELER